MLDLLLIDQISFRLLIFRHCTKCDAKTLIDAEIMAPNRNSRWRPSAMWIVLYWKHMKRSFKDS